MKGDRGVDVACPLGCGALIRGRNPSTIRQHNQTTRQLIRHALREHLVSQHPGLSVRQISVALDWACDGW